MAVVTDTMVFYMRVDPDMIKDFRRIEKRFDDIRRKLFLLDEAEREISKKFIDLSGPKSRAVAMILYHVEDGSHATIKFYSDGLINVEVQFTSLKNFTLETSREYQARFLKGFEINEIRECNILNSGIRRGTKVWSYNILADHRIIETDWDEIIFDSDSTYQNIKIVHSPSNGNILVLDDDVMLGESDLIYTTVLCGIGDNQDMHKENYQNKEVLILGGGDGGILHELQKENPKFITMAEIDLEVIKACRQHLRGVCGDSLDKLKGDNYEIVLDDCVKVLQEFADQGKKVDFVINDLTEYPVEKAIKGFGYDFVTNNLILELSLKVLRKGTGKFLARGNCLNAKDYHKRVEADIAALGLKFKARTIYAPSFMEEYVLYEVYQPEAKA